MQKVANSVVEGTFYTRMDSPVGELTILATDDGIRAVLWESDFGSKDNRVALTALPRKDRHPLAVEVRKQLSEYFARRRTEFDLPLVLEGTPFQLAVWKRLLEIPYGETRSYQEQARRVGDVNKVRAVGAANGKNPISIIVPCHRVIGKDGSLTGFGGGLSKKRLLLDLESGSAHPPGCAPPGRPTARRGAT